MTMRNIERSCRLQPNHKSPCSNTDLYFNFIKVNDEEVQVRFIILIYIHVMKVLYIFGEFIIKHKKHLIIFSIESSTVSLAYIHLKFNRFINGIYMTVKFAVI